MLQPFKRLLSLGAMRTAIPLALVVGVCLPTLAESFGPWYQVSGGAWRVPPTLVAEMRGQIQGAADRASPAQERKAPSIAEYTVQFQGRLRGSGKSVLLRGSCDAEGISSRDLGRQWRIVFDGGPCYFTATYDPSAKQFLSFIFNGEE
jgi:hypothetical protein